MPEIKVSFVEARLEVMRLYCTEGLTFTFKTREGFTNLSRADYTGVIGHTWLYNDYDPGTQTLSIHTSGPTLTCTCDLLYVGKTVTRNITHEYLKGGHHARPI